MVSADPTHLFIFTGYDPGVLEDLNKKAKKAGLHVATGKKTDKYSVRKVKNGKLVAKNISADEVRDVIKEYR
ncbi:hypothetical protein MP11Mi_04800 [Gordonia sp. MP11Mi]|uniref:Uncharacterized protein n=1 Tax=Gordonia sp. MP11Mi TaxID=3022769 RepID=A0AA97GUE5_9ACTN